MKLTLTKTLFPVILTVLLTGVVHAKSRNSGRNTFVADELIIKVRNNVDVTALNLDVADVRQCKK